MLSSQSSKLKNAVKAKHIFALISQQKRDFSHGPYNPLHYKAHLVPEELPTTEDIYANLKTFHSNPPPPIYNMRHVHPVR